MRYVDDARLASRAKLFVRHSIPAAAILLPAAFFVSITSANATEPNSFIYLAYVGVGVLAAGHISCIGLIAPPRRTAHPDDTEGLTKGSRYDLNLWIGHPLEGATHLPS